MATARDGSAPGGVSVAPPIPTARRAVLYAVRHAGDATAAGVADDLDITVSGARQHLTALAEQGLVAAVDAERSPGRRGRAQLTYHVTELGDALFPKAYGALANELLGYLDDEGGGAVDHLFERRRDQRIDRATSRLAGKPSTWEKVEELAAVLDEDGYLATATRLDGRRALVVEHNCAIAHVAARYRQACTSELAFIRAVLPEASVVRTSHMVEGARHCAYEIAW